MNVIDNLPATSWLKNADALSAIKDTCTFTKAESNEVTECFAANLSCHKRLRATDFVLLGVILDHDRFLRQVRRSGLLRISKYAFNYSCLGEVVRDVLDSPVQNKLPEATIAYLRCESLMQSAL